MAKVIVIDNPSDAPVNLYLLSACLAKAAEQFEYFGYESCRITTSKREANGFMSYALQFKYNGTGEGVRMRCVQAGADNMHRFVD